MDKVVEEHTHRLAEATLPMMLFMTSTQRSEYRFYSHHPDRYPSNRKDGWMFSNFADMPIKVGGKVYPTTEHYFQAAKFFKTDPEWAEAIRKAKTPNQSKRMGGSRAHKMNKNWDDVRDEYMKKAIRYKVDQHKVFKRALLNTNTDVLIEASRTDRYWGDGKDGTGKNMLGKVLMEVRDELMNT